MAYLLLAVFTVAYIIKYQNPAYIVSGVGFLVISGLSARSSHVFAKWSYKLVFELALAMNGCADNIDKPISNECGSSK